MTPSSDDEGTAEVGGTNYHGDLQAGLLQQLDRSMMVAIANDDNNTATLVNPGAVDELINTKPFILLLQFL
jgi:hypothetical protein